MVRKVVLFWTLVVIVSSMATPSHAFLNRDCKNLKERVITNQKTYEKNWDSYQTAYGRWQELTDAFQKYDNPEAVNRLRMTLSQGNRIIADLSRFPKCLKPYADKQLRAELTKIASALKDLNGNKGFALLNNYLPVPIDYTKYLK